MCNARNEESEEVKYIVFWDWDEEDTEKGIEKTRKIDKLREKCPARFPKSLGSSYARESPSSGFTLFEATEEQLENWKEFYKPELRVTEIWHIISAQEYIERFESKKKK